MVSIQDKVAMMDLQKKIANRILIARKSEECEIVGFPIKTLPLELWTLHGLTLLWVNNCQLETLDPGIGNLERLQVIKLNNNNIRRIPEEIGHCRALLRLWCHNNKLDMLPRTIGRLEKLEHFSLEKNNLKMFPWEFGRLTSLTALSYDDNKIPGPDYPDVLAALHGKQKDEKWQALQSYLRRLDCAHLDKELFLPSSFFVNQLSEYPAALRLVADLRKVVLSGHRLTDLSLEVLGSMSSVTHLDLSDNLIRVVHRETGNLTMLRSLDLSGNPIETLPIDLGYATNLTTLKLDYDKIKIPAPEISELGADSVIAWLKALCAMRQTCDGEFNGQDIHRLPVEVCFVTTLTRLDIGNNSVRSLSPGISSLVNLTYVNAQNNQLGFLPDSIGALTGVEELNLENNVLTALPDELGLMQSLTSLSLRNNKLTWLPSTIGCLTNMIVLYANHNNLQSLPYRFGEMSNLVELRLHNNELSSAPSTMRHMQCVTILTMQDNLLHLFPQPVCYMNKVTHINLARNLIQHIPREVGNMSSLTSLDLNANVGLEELPLFLGGITQLRILTIECSVLTMPAIEIVRKGIPCVMEHLRYLSEATMEHKLDLSHYGLMKLPAEVSQLPDLRELNLDNNYISEFSEKVCRQCTGMTLLSLRNNRFVEIPEYFGNLVGLTALNLDDNLRLRRLPKSLIEIRPLVELTIANCNLVSPPQDIAARNIREIKAYFEKLVLAEACGELVMDNYSLYEIPPDIPEAIVLKKVVLSGNLIKKMPSDMHRLTCLTELRMDSNLLEKIHWSLGQCTTLEILVLNANRLVELPTCLTSLVNLTELRLEDNLLAGIAPFVSLLTELRLLNLENNMIASVPDELGCLINLETLILSKNPFNQAFPLALCGLTTLKTLSAMESRFTLLPAAFCHLTGLTSINLDPAYIRVPAKEVLAKGLDAVSSYLKELLEAVKTHRLDLSSRSLEEVPVEICSLLGLEELILDGNTFAYLPPQPFREWVDGRKVETTVDIFDIIDNSVYHGIPDMMDLHTLVLLSAKNNQLCMIPPEIADLSALTVLHLDHNKLQDLPEELGMCTALTELTITNNEMAVLPVTLGNLVNLKVFDADWESRIAAPPKEIFSKRHEKGVGFILEYMQLYIEAREGHEIDLSDLQLDAMPQALVDDEIGKILGTIVSISLSSNKLSYIHDSVGMMSSLVALDLSENHILDMPESFCDCVSLEAFYMDGNRITELPRELGKLVRLKYLSLNRCRLTTFPPSIRKCKALQVLRADKNRFNVLPQTLALNASLKDMSFADNKIPSVPQIFRRMAGLQRIDLERNTMSTIPQVFMQWTTLTELRLKGNPLTSLPLNFTALLQIKVAEFDWDDLILPPAEVAKGGNKLLFDYLTRIDSAMRRLKLDASNMQLMDVPLHLVSIEKLMLLNMSNNPVRVIGDHIGKLLRLNTFQADSTFIQSLPKEFCYLTLLTEISITKSRIAILPHDVGNLVLLTNLQLVENAIQELPLSFTQLTSLTTFNIRHNRLKLLAVNIGGNEISLGPFATLYSGGLQKLTNLDVSFNKIKEIPRSILSMTRLKSLQMDNNEVHTMPDGLKRLKECDTLTIDVQNLTVLKRLNLADMNLSVAPPREIVMRGNETLVSFFKKLQSVQKTNRLFLDGLGLRHFPEEILVMTDLLTLSLANNNITEVTQKITRLMDLEILDLKRNELQILPNMEKFEGLAELFLNNNSLTYLPPSIGLCTDLEDLNILFNPLQDPPLEVTLRGREAILEHLVKQENIKFTSKLEMREISFAGKYLSYFPEPWCNLPEHYMVTVDVSHNWIASIPDGISRLVSLVAFDASHNRLVSIPPAFGELYNLEDLSLSHNRLLFVPEELTRLDALQLLNVEETYLGASPLDGILAEARGQVKYYCALVSGREDGIVNMPSLGLTSVPEDVLQWPGVAIVEAKIISISIIDLGLGLPPEAHGFKDIETLVIDNNAFSTLDARFAKIETLQTLSMINNQVLTLCLEMVQMTALTKLDLSLNLVRTFPDAFHFPPNLKHFSIAKCKVREFPPSIGLLASLEFVDATDNSLQEVCVEIGGCTALTELHLSANFLKGIPREIGNLVNMKVVDLSKNQLVSIPSQFGLMSNITRLNLHENELIYVPPSLAWIGGMRHLTLHTNAIHVLPRAICKLVELETLDFGFNDMDRLLPYIGCFTGMTELKLSNNALEELPMQFGKMTSLTSLELDKNKLEWLHKSIGNMTNLTHLGLSFNNLEDLPIEFFDLTALTSLALNNNKLSIISGALSAFNKMKTLYLSHNEFKSFPESVGNLRSLEKLSVGFNNFRRVPDVLTRLKKLGELWVSENLTFSDDDALPPWMSKMVALKVVMIDDDPRRSPPEVVAERGIKKMLAFVARVNASRASGHLDLSALGLRECPFAPFPRKITILQLSNNKIEKIDENVTVLGLLEELLISDNRISELPFNIDRLIRLRKLVVSRNRITKLSDAFGPGMKMLVRFDINHNRLQELPASLALNTVLRELRVSGNLLKELPFEMHFMTQLSTLRLEENNWKDSMEEASKMEIEPLLAFLKQLYEARESKILDLSKQRIKDVPGMVLRLSDMEKLDLRHNKITEIPSFICLLVELRDLNIRDNRVKDLPQELGSVRGLEILDAGQNKLYRVPECLASLENLTNLWLDQNGIKEIPDWFPKLISLKYLNIDYNKLKMMPPEFGAMLRLEQLLMVSNRFLNFPATCCEVLTMVELSICDAENIISMPASIINLQPKLRKLVMNGCSLSRIHDSVGYCTNLTILSFANNNVTVVPHTFHMLTQCHVLNLQGNRIVAFPDIFNLTNLTHLNLSDNEITTVDLRIGDLNQMEELNLNNNKIASIPLTIATLTCLTELDLQRNRIMTLPWAIGTLDSLTQLQLHSNLLTSCPPTMSNLVNIRILTLRDNQISEVPDFVASLTELKRLTLKQKSLKGLPEISVQRVGEDAKEVPPTPPAWTPREDYGEDSRKFFQANEAEEDGRMGPQKNMRFNA